MTLLDEAARQCDNADLVILALVEGIRGREREATAVAIASQIRGAPPEVIRERTGRMRRLGLLELAPAGRGYALSLMGAELLLREMPGWRPNEREMARRDSYALSASTGAIAPLRAR